MAVLVPPGLHGITGAPTFNGMVILIPPTTPAPESVQISYQVSVGKVTSPFSLQTQTQAWVGGDLWTGTVHLPPMSEQNFEAWNAFLMQLQGPTNVFQIGLSYRTGPLPGGATNKGTPVVISGAVGSNSLLTSGWTPNTYRLLLPGDLIQVGYRLYKVAQPVQSDGSGHATLSVYPSLREAPTAGAAVVLNRPVGIFRLASNKYDYSLGENGIVQNFSFGIMEAR